MTAAELQDFVQAAEGVYESRLRPLLEPAHQGKFVAIDPGTGDYYLGQSLSEAMGAARRAHPGRLVHAIRIGHKAAVQIGVHLK